MLSTRGEKSTFSSATSRYIGSSAAMHSSMLRSLAISSLLRTSIKGSDPFSFGFDARFLDGAAVAVHVGADRGGEALRRAAERLVGLLRQLLAQVRRLQHLVELGIEARLDRGRHAARGHQPEPEIELHVGVARFAQR